MTAAIKASAAELCEGRLVLVHEGGYSEVYVLFCGHATISILADSTIEAPDPLRRLSPSASRVASLLSPRHICR